MLIRIVNYFPPGGGHTRFAIELIKALCRRPSGNALEMVAYRGGVELNRQLLEAEDVHLPIRNVRPSNMWAATAPQRIRDVRGTGRLKRLLGYGRHTYFEIPDAIYEDCDLVWLPWAHRHRVPRSRAHRTIATLHDTILLEFADQMMAHGLDKRIFTQEQETIRQWLESPARVVVTSHATIRSLQSFFAVPVERFEVIRLLAGHVDRRRTREAPADWRWARGPFILCPANVTPHKNHDVLLRGVAAWSAAYPLVLTGLNSDLPSANPNTARPRQLAERLNLKIGESLVPLGYVDDELYFGLLKRSWAVVMPTLAEGGGSFPVLEAMLCGIPVLCSDIPVMREQIAETGGDLLWFNPHDSQDLTEKLKELRANYHYYKSRAVQQIDSLRLRTWSDIAADYERLMAAMIAGETPRREAAIV